MPRRSFLISLFGNLRRHSSYIPNPDSSQSLKPDLPVFFLPELSNKVKMREGVELVCHTVTCTHSYLGREEINRPGSGLIAGNLSLKNDGCLGWYLTDNIENKVTAHILLPLKKELLFKTPEESGVWLFDYTFLMQRSDVMSYRIKLGSWTWIEVSGKLTGLIQVWVFRICPAMISGASIWG